MTIALARGLRPSVSLPPCVETEADLAGRSNFGSTPSVKREAILASHYNATPGRRAEPQVVWAHPDPSSVNYTHHPATAGWGIVPDDKHMRLLGHRTLVTTPERTPLGLINPQIISRDQANYGNKHQRQQRPREDQDSYQWIVNLEATVTIQTAGPATLIVNVADREGDIYDAFRYAPESGASILVRAAWNRAIESQENSRWEPRESRHAKDELLEVSVPRNHKRPARRAKLAVRYSQLRLKPPSHSQVEQLPSIKVDAGLVPEEPPPPGEEPIEWLLLTTGPVNRVEDAKERVQWYSCRWSIEIYHQVLHSGGLIEERPFEAANRSERYLAIDSVVAWRVLGLTLPSRETPDPSGEAWLDPQEWQALYCYLNQVPTAPKEPPKLRETAR